MRRNQAFQMLAECGKTAHLIWFFDSTTARAHVPATGAKGGSRVDLAPRHQLLPGVIAVAAVGQPCAGPVPADVAHQAADVAGKPNGAIVSPTWRV